MGDVPEIVDAAPPFHKRGRAAACMTMVLLSSRRLGAAIALFAFCTSAVKALPSDERSTDERTAFVTSALEKLRNHHVNRSRLDWNAVEMAAIEKARAAQSNDALYEIVDGVIRDLGEAHSFLVRPRPLTGIASPAGSAQRKAPAFEASLVEGIGYIDLPTFVGGGESAVAFGQEIRAALIRLDRSPLCGWIVDLRSNEGGNMHAALLGLGRILGEGRLGSVDGGAVPQYWHYRSNRMIVSDFGDIENMTVPATSPFGTSPIVRGVRQTLALPAESPEVGQFGLPVAVLIGKHTMSSGEGIAVSFIGRPLARTFGARTAGRSSANLGFKLGGGEMLVVTYGAFADRNGRRHSPSVIPDQEIGSGGALSTSKSSDDVVASALRWIHSQQKCPP